MPKTNAAGVSIIKSDEGDVLTAYGDPRTGGEPWTIGYGHTGSCAAIGINADVHPGMTISQAQADALLAADLESTERGVNALCARSLNSNQFSALVSFAYNEGVGQLATSTLMALVNAGHFTEAAYQFQFWIYAQGRVMPGLVKRRAQEAALFATPIAPAKPAA